MKNTYIIMDKEDNCATSLQDISEGTEVRINNETIKFNHKVPFGHKFALKDITSGSHIIKYGQIIGIATNDIKKGEWIHTHNIKSHYLELITNG
jgi:altronate dehydratase